MLNIIKGLVCLLIICCLTVNITYAIELNTYRWSKTSMPLNVFIIQNSNIPGFDKSFPVQVAKALRQWKIDSKGLVDFNFVEDKNKADIIISWKEKIKKEDLQNQVEGHGYVWGITKLGNPTSIVLVTKHPLNDKQALLPNNVYMIALHEIGHALGMWWHTRDPEDIMYPDFIMPSTSSNGSRMIINKNQGTLTSRDLKNLESLYYNNKVHLLNEIPRGERIKTASSFKPIYELVETTGTAAASVATKSKNVNNIDLGKALALLKKDPNNYEAHNNVGLVYLESKNYDEAVKSFKKSLKLNPVYAIAYFNLALTYNQAKKYDLAIANYEKFLNLEPEGDNSELARKQIERLKTINK